MISQIEISSVQVMYREPQVATAAGPVQYAQGGYEAFLGRYALVPGSGTFTCRVEGALVRSLIGEELVAVSSCPATG